MQEHARQRGGTSNTDGDITVNAFPNFKCGHHYIGSDIILAIFPEL